MTNISFNSNNWNHLIKSQENILTPNGIIKAAKHLKEDLASEKGKGMLHLTPSDINPEIINLGVLDRIAGYDMPCSFTGDNWNGEYLFFCFQDPLRNSENDNGLTLTSPFGLTCKPMREGKKSYGIVWGTIKKVVESGYGVWVTDANKLWLNKRLGDSEQKDISELNKSTLLKEIELTAPKKVIAFGNHAHRLLSKHLGAGNNTVQLLHPAAWGSHWDKFYPDTITLGMSPEQRYKAKVDTYVGQIMHSERE